eukprot:CAMPEP_0119556428 /NCGR_PEP_ID=MMETSP1352-20130426/8392_1 /TAXON_ID=265584 /ORGANISM="Stauroneis constricta, Strain CCMP1120" /LENGTH=501 /DNA_ID=CAMNT_0007603391 /DNA_START=217 /DNA_END=1722 /DNA_ORIENTATION=+
METEVPKSGDAAAEPSTTAASAVPVAPSNANAADAISPSQPTTSSDGDEMSADPDESTHDVQTTCNVLCSLLSASAKESESECAAAADDESEPLTGAAAAVAAAAPTPPKPKGRPGSAKKSASKAGSQDGGGGGKGSSSGRRCSGAKSMCPKQHQLPMFLTKTYHMIDRCDSDIATWSDTGDNFVVKNVEKFASNVLPLYFKHSNFSSFARQLNFYGFRKLRTDPILTTDVDPRTSCYVRFYHEKFQKDRPELLHHIKRATKSDPHTTKDDMDTLKTEVSKYQQTLHLVTQEFDRKLQSMRDEYNRKLVTLTTEYDQLAGLVHQLLAHHQVIQQQITAQAVAANVAAQPAPQAAAPVAETTAAVPTESAPASAQPPDNAAASSTPTAAPAPAALPILLQGAAAAPGQSGVAAAGLTVPPIRIPTLLSHLSQVASMNLQQSLVPPKSSLSASLAASIAPTSASGTGSHDNSLSAIASLGTKRPLDEDDSSAHHAATKQKPSS